jgi:CheY-like chemotaxis protein
VDLEILDVDMPWLDGLGVLEELRAQVRTACLPVIVLTAQHGETEEKALISALTTISASRCRPALSSPESERCSSAQAAEQPRVSSYGRGLPAAGPRAK